MTAEKISTEFRVAGEKYRIALVTLCDNGECVSGHSGGPALDREAVEECVEAVREAIYPASEYQTDSNFAAWNGGEHDQFGIRIGFVNCRESAIEVCCEPDDSDDADDDGKAWYEAAITAEVRAAAEVVLGKIDDVYSAAIAMWQKSEAEFLAESSGD